MATGRVVMRRPRVPAWSIDVGVPLVVFLYTIAVQGVSAPWWEFLLSAALCLPWFWRRRSPVGAAVVLMLVAVLQLAAGVPPLPADLMMVLLLGSLSSRSPTSWSAPALGVVVAWMLVMSTLHSQAQGLSIGDVVLFVVLPVTAWVTGRLTRARREVLAALQERAAQLEREQAVRARMATLQERTRIARELHDVVSHDLSGVTLLAEGALSSLDGDPDRARAAVTTIRDTSRGAMTRMRSILDVLRADDEVDEPGLSDLPDLVRSAQDAGMPVTLTVEGGVGDTPADTHLVVYRIVQEALTNVRRHAADVTAVEVRVDVAPHRVDVLVRNDGRAAAGGGRPGHGLVGMRERVEALGGTVLAGPTGAGFEVTASLPGGEQR